MAHIVLLNEPESSFSGPPMPRDDRHGVGVTHAKRWPPYVYSQRGSLVHRVVGVRMYWYALVNRDEMRRLKQPSVIYETACGNSFFGRARRGKRAVVCAVPAVDAVLCGKCHGKKPTFSPQGDGTATGLTRREARMRIGCMPEV